MRPRSGRLAVVATHPVQYYAPWFRYIAEHLALELRVFYLWDAGATARFDAKFERQVQWDVPLLDGYEHEFVPNHSWRPGTDRVGGLWNPALLHRMRAWNPDAILLMAYNYLTFYRLLAAWPATGAPLLFRGDSHRLVARPGIAEGAKAHIIRAVFGRMGACLYTGAANRRYFEAAGVPDERLFFTPHAVDMERFVEAARAPDGGRAARAWRGALGIPADHRVVLFVGKLEAKKRPADLLRAFQSARPDRATLVFVGSGAEQSSLAAQTHGDPTVRLVSFRNQSEMPAVYQGADLLVLPSVGPAETWGLAVNEAMSAGLPAIVSSHVGCAEDLVRPGATGLVFPAGDVTALAAALREALSDDVRLRAWGHSARRHVEGYSYARATAGLLDALRHLGCAAPDAAREPVGAAC